MSVKGWIEVDEHHCKGCELCVWACPKDVLALDTARLTARGYHPVVLVREGCTGCALCAVMCPDAALTVYQEQATARRRREALRVA